MSYILEALRKSERERRAGPGAAGLVPATYVVAPEGRKGSIGAALLAAGMLAAGLALGAWRPWQASTSAREERAAAAETKPTAPSAREAVRPVAYSPPEPEPAPALQMASQAALPPPAAQTAQPAAPASAPARPAAQAKAAPVSPPRPAARVRENKPAAARAEVVAYGELPASVREGMPRIVFGGYAGVEEDEAKVAFINSRLVKEGEEISPGVKLEKVGPEGVVLGYQGWRFRPSP